MGLRDFLKKKDQLDKGGAADPDTVQRLAAPEFTFIRSDTHTEEVIHPPSGPASRADSGSHNPQHLSPGGGSRSRGLGDVFKSRSRSTSVSSQVSTTSTRESRRLSERLHLSRAPPSSDNVPAYLPDIVAPADGASDGTTAQWEKRATMLARENDKHRSRPGTPVNGDLTDRFGHMGVDDGITKSGAQTDEDIQEAIRLHEAGDLENSTKLFAKLADPNGANNPLSQVLYGLALRHGWGCNPDTAAAVNYLSKAASNSAVIEDAALKAGLKKGGAAKGELVLAIFELANCFRHGWGIPKDPIAAKQYYETAANLGDTDAMNETGWCYLEGFGTKKDRFAAAKYYRLAEQNGNKTLGNSWIWKEKYDPENAKK